MSPVETGAAGSVRVPTLVYQVHDDLVTRQALVSKGSRCRLDAS